MFLALMLLELSAWLCTLHWPPHGLFLCIQPWRA
jgi:hypothetical protein